MRWPFEIQDQDAIVPIHDSAAADPLPDLVALELMLGQRQVRRIVLELHDGAAIPTERLARLSYRPLAPDRYVKTIPTRRAVRFSITEKCNYKCFFCHEEGLEMERVRQGAHEEQVFRVLDQLKALDYNDLTFTGGERCCGGSRSCLTWTICGGSITCRISSSSAMVWPCSKRS